MTTAELSRQMIEAYERGLSIADIAKIFEVNYHKVYQTIRKKDQLTLSISLQPGEQIAWVPGHEGRYKVTTHGRVFSFLQRQPRELSQFRSKKTHPQVVLQVGKEQGNSNGQKSFSVHRLVLETFVGPCPEGMECCHNNGSKINNHLSNLRWDTHKNNEADKIDHDTVLRGSRNGNSKLTEDQVREIRSRYIPYSKNANTNTLAAEYGVHPTKIHQIVTGKVWTHI